MSLFQDNIALILLSTFSVIAFLYIHTKFKSQKKQFSLSLDKLQSLINGISRVENSKDLVDQIFRDIENNFSFDYTIITLIDFCDRKIISKTDSSYAKQWINDEFTSEKDSLDDSNQTDILLKIIRSNCLKPIFVYGDNLISDAEGFKFSDLDLEVYNKFDHKSLIRVFIPIVFRKKQVKDNIDSVKDFVIGVSEFGYYGSESIIERKVTKNIKAHFSNFDMNRLELYLDNVAQLYFKNYISENKDYLRQKLAELSIKDKSTFLNESIDILVKHFKIDAASISHLDISNPIQLIKPQRDLYFNYNLTNVDGEFFLNEYSVNSINSTLLKSYSYDKENKYLGICNQVVKQYTDNSKIAGVSSINDDFVLFNCSRDSSDKQPYYVSINKDFQSELGIQIITPKNNLIAVLIISSFQHNFFNEVSIELLRYFGKILGNRFLTSTRYNSIGRLNQPLTIFNYKNVITNLVDQVSNYYATTNLIIWKRENNKLFKPLELDGVSQYKFLGDLDLVISSDIDDRLNHIGTNINLNYLHESEPDSPILVEDINDASPLAFKSINASQLRNKKYAFKSVILLRLPTSQIHDYFITIFSKRYLKQEAISEFGEEFAISIMDRFQDAIQTSSVVDILRNSDVTNLDNLLRYILNSAIPIFNADVAGLLIYDPLKKGFSNKLVLGKSWDDNQMSRSYNLSKSLINSSHKEKDYILLKNFTEIEALYKNLTGNELDKNDFLVKAGIKALIAIPLIYRNEKSNESLILGLLMIEYLDSSKIVEGYSTQQNILIFKNLCTTLLLRNSNVKNQVESLNSKIKKLEDQRVRIEEEKNFLISLTKELVNANTELKTLGASSTYYNLFHLLNHEIFNSIHLLRDNLISDGLEIPKYIDGSVKIIKIVLELFDTGVDKREYFDLNEVIANLVQVVKFQSKNIHYHTNLADEYLELYWNKSHFSIIIYNIISNSIYAVKMSKKKEKVIKINTWSTDKNICISIKDNGIGIPKDDLKKIYTLHYSTKNPSDSNVIGKLLSKRKKGHGIGLNFVFNSLVLDTDYQVSLECDSTEGSHTKFTITIPKHLSK